MVVLVAVDLVPNEQIRAALLTVDGPGLVPLRSGCPKEKVRETSAHTHAHSRTLTRALAETRTRHPPHPPIRHVRCCPDTDQDAELQQPGGFVRGQRMLWTDH